MRPILSVLLLIACLAPAQAAPDGREAIEADLRLELSRKSTDRVRRTDPIQLGARLRNTSSSRSHKVVAAGEGSAWGIVEPHVYYTGRVQSSDGSWKPVARQTFRGMCGMGDYRWQRNVSDLAPKADLDLSDRLMGPGALLKLPEGGLVELRLHYEFRGKGSTEKLPTGDPVGDLGPMKDVPAYHLVSNPVRVRILHPVEIVLRDRGVKSSKSGGRLSAHLEARLENWTREDLALDLGRLEVTVEVRPAEAAVRRKRKTLHVDTALAKKTLHDGNALDLLGPYGVHDEFWVREADAEPLEARLVVRGVPGRDAPAESDWVRVTGL